MCSKVLCSTANYFRVEAPVKDADLCRLWESLAEFATHNNNLIKVRVINDSLPVALLPPEKLRSALAANVFLQKDRMKHAYVEHFADSTIECDAFHTKFILMGIFFCPFLYFICC